MSTRLHLREKTLREVLLVPKRFALVDVVHFPRYTHGSGGDCRSGAWIGSTWTGVSFLLHGCIVLAPIYTCFNPPVPFRESLLSSDRKKHTSTCHTAGSLLSLQHALLLGCVSWIKCSSEYQKQNPRNFRTSLDHYHKIQDSVVL